MSACPHRGMSRSKWGLLNMYCFLAPVIWCFIAWVVIITPQYGGIAYAHNWCFSGVTESLRKAGYLPGIAAVFPLHHGVCAFISCRHLRPGVRVCTFSSLFLLDIALVVPALQRGVVHIALTGTSTLFNLMTQLCILCLAKRKRLILVCMFCQYVCVGAVAYYILKFFDAPCKLLQFSLFEIGFIFWIGVQMWVMIHEDGGHQVDRSNWSSLDDLDEAELEEVKSVRDFRIEPNMIGPHSSSGHSAPE